MSHAMKFAALAFLNNEVEPELDLVRSPVWPLGRYLKQKLKSTVLEGYSVKVRPTDGGKPDLFNLNMELTSVTNMKFAERTFEAAGVMHGVHCRGHQMEGPWEIRGEYL